LFKVQIRAFIGLLGGGAYTKVTLSALYSLSQTLIGVRELIWSTLLGHDRSQAG